MSDQSFGEVLRRVARSGLSLVGAMLGIGLILSSAGQDHTARLFFIGGLGTLVALPIVNVIVEVAEEVRRREWVFLGVAAIVLLILLYNARHLANVFGT